MGNWDLYGIGASFEKYNFKDKKRSVKYYIRYMLNRTQSMFEYDNLPETLPQRMIELYAQTLGHVAIVKHEDNLYACFGNWGGKPNAYYIPTQYVIANPYLNLFKTYDIDKNCVILQNDSLYIGLMPMFSRYANLLVENDITMRMYDINTRIQALIEAPNDRLKASADKFLHDIELGELGTIASNEFLDGIRTSAYGQNANQRITDLVEYHQYLKASWFNEIGLNANYNMKREAINSNESRLNDDALIPLIDDMLQCRKEAVEKINIMFGTDIEVRFNSAWYDNEIEQEIELDNLDNLDSDLSEMGDNDANEMSNDSNDNDSYDNDSDDSDTETIMIETENITIETNKGVIIEDEIETVEDETSVSTNDNG